MATNFGFSKISLAGKDSSFVTINEGSVEFQEQYLDYFISSHEAYPSPWAAAVYFAKVLENLNPNRLNEIQKRAVDLIDAYLKGVFLGILRPEQIHFDYISDDLKNILKEQYPKDIEHNANPFIKGYIVMLKYREDFVCFEYPETLFAPVSYFSWWPDKPNSQEEAMIKEIIDTFENQPAEVKDIFKNYLNLIYSSHNTTGSTWANVFSALKIDGKSYASLPKFSGNLHQVNNYSFGIHIKYCDGCFDYIKEKENGKEMSRKNLIVYSPFKSEEIKFSIRPGSIIIDVINMGPESKSITIHAGCKGRDNNFYVIEDKFNPISLGNLYIELSQISREYEGKGPWLTGTKFKTANLIIRDRISSQIKESQPVYLVKFDDIFVPKIIKIGGKTPDIALKKVFARIPDEKNPIGFELIKLEENKYNVPNVGEKVYKSQDIINVDPTLAVWPEYFYEDWNPYFFYLNPAPGIGCKFLSMPANELSLSASDISVRRVDKAFLEEPAITFYEDKNRNELGSFYLFDRFLNRYKLKPDGSTIYVGLDFGTTTSVISTAILRNDNSIAPSLVLDFEIRPKTIFGFEDKIDIHHFPIGKAQEIPSLLYLKNGKLGDLGKAFEETTLIFFGHNFFKPNSFIPHNIKKHLKWQGNIEEIAAYLYMLLLGTLNILYQNYNPKEVKFILSYPLAFTSKRFHSLQSAVGLINSQLKNDIPALFNHKDNDYFRFISESETVARTNILKDTLIIDMGGGSTDFVYIQYQDGQPKPILVDSIKIAGETPLTWLSNIFNLDENKLKEDLYQNENYLKSKISEMKQSQLEKFENYTKFFLKYISRGLSFITQRDNIFPGISAKDIESSMKKNIDIRLYGNGWNIIKPFAIHNMKLINHVASMLGIAVNNIKFDVDENNINNPKNRKTYLSRLLAHRWNDAHPLEKEENYQFLAGLKTIMGLTLLIDKERKFWYTEIPHIIKKGSSPRLIFPPDSDNYEYSIFAGLTPEYINNKFAWIDNLLGNVQPSMERGIVKSPLAYVLEEYAEEYLYK